MTIDNGNL